MKQGKPHLLSGQGSSPGISMGPFYFLQSFHPTIPHRLPTHLISAELRRLEEATAKACKEWNETTLRLSPTLSKNQKRIMDSYLMLLQDPLFLKTIKGYIRQHHLPSEAACKLTEQELSSPYLERTDEFSIKHREDIQVVISQIISHLTQSDPLDYELRSHLKDHILVADLIRPDQVARLARLQAKGFITRAGGKNSHTMILARSLSLPAICGVENIKELSGAKFGILNGFEGKIILDPSPQERKTHQELAQKQDLLEKLLLEDACEPAVTRDGQRIRMEANLELPEEIPSALRHGAEGVGLFRTEVPFWNPEQPPSEKTQRKLYHKILQSLGKTPITFRTFDFAEANNPTLGLRGIRYTLKHSDLLRSQLSALSQAAADFPVPKPINILLPMVSSIEEMEKFQQIYHQVCPVKRRKNIRIGIMVEVPAAALLLPVLAPTVDFFAVGSNDLIQYTLAWDRGAEPFLLPSPSYHPAVLKTLHQIAQHAKACAKPVYLCGELGADPLFLPLLLGMGFRHFSMNPLAIPRGKKTIRALSIKECTGFTQKILQLGRIREIEKELEKFRFKLDT